MYVQHVRRVHVQCHVHVIVQDFDEHEYDIDTYYYIDSHGIITSDNDIVKMVRLVRTSSPIHGPNHALVLSIACIICIVFVGV